VVNRGTAIPRSERSNDCMSRFGIYVASRVIIPNRIEGGLARRERFPPHFSQDHLQNDSSMAPQTDPLLHGTLVSGFEVDVSHRIDTAHPQPATTGPLDRSGSVRQTSQAVPPPRALSGHSSAVDPPTGPPTGPRFDDATPVDRSAVDRMEQTSPAGRQGSRSPLDLGLIGIAHAEDLLQQIQSLSEDLDARSATLNANIAVQERRERAFRLWAQQRSEELRQMHAACEQERLRLAAQARRMAHTPTGFTSTP